jgi:predicted dehydrogenase
MPTDRRYDSDFPTLRHLINSNAFGTIIEFENHYDLEMPSWMVRNKTLKYVPGEGMAFGLGSHSVDQALVLFGRPASVTGFLRSLRGIESEVDDTFTIILQYSGEQKNLLVTIKTTIVSLMTDQFKTFVRGTEGSFVKVSLMNTHAFSIFGLWLELSNVDIVRHRCAREPDFCRPSCH